MFILPGIALPPDTAAAVYLQVSSQTDPNAALQFKFLGGIGTGKESAVFKISSLVSGCSGSSGVGLETNTGEVDMDAPEGSNGQQLCEVRIGISLESAESVSAQMAARRLETSSTSTPTSALVLAARNAMPKPNNVTDHETKIKLAQKIIKNAFNFLASYSGNLQNGVEVVPLKAFEEWWRKFEGRVRSDPGFLERPGEDY